MSQFNDPIFIKWNKDTNGNKISVKITNEQATIVKNQVFLKELPDVYNKVLIDNMYETDGEITAENLYKVDYSNGSIYFHPSKDGQTLSINEYYGRGVLMYPSSRIWTKINDLGEVQETLSDFIDSGRIAVEMANDIQGVLDDGGVLKGELNTSIGTANTLKSGLDDSISDATLINDTLSNPTNGTIKIATDINTTLDSTVNVANTSKDELQQVITNSDVIVRNGDLDDVVEGVIPLDAELLGGQQPNYYASKDSVESHKADYAKSEWTLIEFGAVVSVPPSSFTEIFPTAINSLKNDFELDSNGRLRCLRAGRYEFYAKINITGNSSGIRREFRLRLLDSVELVTDRRNPVTTASVNFMPQIYRQMSVNDVIQFEAFQDSSISLDIPTNTDVNRRGYCWIRRVRNA